MNIPNFLTTIRFMLIPLFIYYFFAQINNNLYIAIAVFILAGITDVLDGYIARKYKMITRLGIVLDPLADKLMLITVLLCISIRYQIPMWMILVVIIKESLMIGGAIALYNGHNVVVPANRLGKMSTVSFYAAALAVAFNLKIGVLLMNVFVVLTISALIGYLSNYIKIKKRNKMDLIKK